ncbi:MAG: DUF433 domain-containing protein [Hahellaceae bacterium]|nr:DUF433 domain-containing protein [Hahellaceae bacterium]
MNGQPCIRDTRLTVRRVLKGLALYPDWRELMTEYPGFSEVLGSAPQRRNGGSPDTIT